VDVWTIRPESATQELLRAGRGAGGGCARGRTDRSRRGSLDRARDNVGGATFQMSFAACWVIGLR